VRSVMKIETSLRTRDMARGTASEVLKGSDIGKRTTLRQPPKRAPDRA
jgi:hypothetical protein